MERKMKWLITGGCGFIGTALIKSLVDEGGHFVRVVDNLSVGTRDDLARVCEYDEAGDAGVQLLVGDIMDEALALDAGRDMDVIVHLAANPGVGPSVENPRLDCVTNVIGTLNYLESARANGIRRFVFASSGAPVGECIPPIHEEMAPHPVSPYGASKLAGEGYCSAYFRTYGVETVSLRFGNVYGPGSGHKSSVVAKFIRQALKGEMLEVYGDGRQTREFIYIEDLVGAIRKAAEVPGVGGEVFQIATGSETTVGEMLEILFAEFERRGIRGVRFVNGEKRLGDIVRNFSDTSKAGRMLGWQVQTQLAEGIGTTIDSFLSGSTPG